MVSISPTTTSSTSSTSTSTSAASQTANAGQGLITALGTGSGLDLEGLVTKIIDAQRGPQQAQLDSESSYTQANISAYGTLQNTLSSIQDAVKNLKDSKFFNTQTATSGDSSLFTATSDGTAINTSYRVEVFDMAQANKIVMQNGVSSPAANLGSGTINISLAGGKSFTVNVGASDSLATIRDNINNSSGNIGVTASLVTVDAGLNNGSTVTKLMLMSNNSGKSNQISISVNDNDGNNTDNSGLSQLYFDGSNPSAAGNNMKQIDVAQDARIAVDGMTVYSDTNAFTHVIPGVTINILKGSNGAVTPPSAMLAINTDKSGAKGEITGLVGVYNAAIGVLNKLTAYDASTKTAGQLNGDSTVSAIEQQMRSILFGTVPGATNGLNSLAMLGITTNADGTLTANDDKVNQAIAYNYQDLTNLFSGSNGIASRLDTALTNILGTSGSIALREQGFQNDLKDIGNRTQQLNDRLSVEEASIRSQFSALDALIQQMNQTSSFLTQQLNANSNSSSKK